MAACEKVEFYHPIAVGQLVELIASVSREGRSSMTVQVEVLCENLPTGGRLRAIDGHFEMVAVDEKGKPKPFQPSL